jgi:sec-independent protein translocase protein TatC
MAGAVGDLVDQDDAEELPKQTVLEHLDELRSRLIKTVIGLAITTLISFLFTRQLFDFLILPAGGIKPIFTEVTEMFGTYFKVAFLSGLALGMPIIIYHVVMFLAPALTRQEKRYFRLLLPGVAISFIAGATFGYYLVLPRALQFLLNFGGEIATPQIKIGNYVSFVTTILFWIGLIFETPIVLYFLAKLRIINYRTLAKNRKYALLGAFVVAAVATPTPDPITQSMVAIPLLLLYEAGIWLARIA